VSQGLIWRNETATPSNCPIHLIEDLEGGTHGGLEVDTTDVLPLLLEERHKEIAGKLSVKTDLFHLHAHVANRDVKAHDLLHLELDGSLDLVALGLERIVGTAKGRELASLIETGAEKTGDLLDEGVRSDEGVVLGGELLDDLLVLVELLEVVNRHAVELGLGGLLYVDGVTEHADLHVRTGDGGELEGARETLVLGGVVGLETELEVDSLDELALLALEGGAVLLNLLALRKREACLDGIREEFGVDLGLREEEAKQSCVLETYRGAEDARRCESPVYGT
jgi:hypothetical protein